MKKCCAILLLLAMLLGGCTASGPKQYSATYLDLFDTVTTVMGFAETEAEFHQNARKIYESLARYHRLFDIYKEYEGITNLKTVNDNAGIAPVKVDPAIIALLRACKEYCVLTEGKVNAAMGSILRLWHDARSLGLSDPENARLPDAQALAQAAAHISFDSVIIDEAASTVYISDPETSLDVGAVAKGWAAQKVAEQAPAGMLISVGGNVCATGAKDENGTPWVIGIQHPEDSGKYLYTIRVTKGAVVTSGDYQRTYTVDGRQYHHIIDPETQMPSEFWRSVTVVCADSALADALSTALFLLPLPEGQTLAEKCSAQALWYDGAGNEYMTPGFRALVQ